MEDNSSNLVDTSTSNYKNVSVLRSDKALIKRILVLLDEKTFLTFNELEELFTKFNYRKWLELEEKKKHLLYAKACSIKTSKDAKISYSSYINILYPNLSFDSLPNAPKKVFTIMQLVDREFFHLPLSAKDKERLRTYKNEQNKIALWKAAGGH